MNKITEQFKEELEKKKQEAVDLYYNKHLTLEKIAKKFGITEQCVKYYIDSLERNKIEI